MDEPGGYLGTVMDGRRVPLLVLTVGPGGTPALPVAPPLAELYDSAGTLQASFSLPAMDPAGTPGLYGMGVKLAGLPLDRYAVLYSYDLGDGVTRLQLDFLDYVQGDPAGSVISVYAQDRPEARYVLAQLDGGRLVQGRNPRF